ncbi:MAG: tRNA (guanosine(37)-N1)-methyltransferase TrmD [Deltaproteobacteria bacterium]|nr:tRNA (guanosine(37)-N1)-methyltransferase TrmD [Deltaproteobacteria bacterium]
MVFFDIISLFPDFFSSALEESILGKAQEKGLIRVGVHNLRNYAGDKHRVTDDCPYGGGAGMVLKPEPVAEAIEKIRDADRNAQVVLLTPQGETFTQALAGELTHYEQIVLVCGRYEGVDGRIRNFVDREVSIGDYILSGGEAAALVVLEAVSRLVDGVLGNDESLTGESFTDGLLEYPQYTRPQTFRGYDVPGVLLSGNHEEIRRWRLREALKITLHRRPDLLKTKVLSNEEQQMLYDIEREMTM